MFLKTRIAPTPSGFLHLGNVLSFAITAAIAESKGVSILLRIDDLDQARVNKAYLQDVFDTLNFLEIPWQQGPRDLAGFEENYSQLLRMHLYRDALKQLNDNRLVFACTCSRTEVASCNCRAKNILLTTEGASWRLITDTETVITVKSINGKITNARLPPEMKNFIVKKKDGHPAYQLTSLIDDIYYGVDLVVRGDDLWPSTLAQLQLAHALNRDDFKEVCFLHHPLLMAADGNKLSKSAGAASVKHLRESGKTAADIYSIIAGLTGINQAVNNWQQLGAAIGVV